MHYSSKTGGFAPADFLLQIIGLKIDYNQLLLAKSELFEGRNFKNGEINVFFDCCYVKKWSENPSKSTENGP